MKSIYCKAFAIGLTMIGLPSLAAEEKRPNILFILIDDMGWKDMSCTGSSYYETPHIDALAKSGMLFKNAYSSSPVCAPSRGAIFSGNSPARTKYSAVFFEKEQTEDDQLFEKSKNRGASNQHYEALHTHVLPSQEILFAEPLTQVGYTTGFFGKWHCGSHPDYTPDKRGFQVAKGFRNKHVGTTTSGHWGKTFKRYGVGMNGLADDVYISDALTDECISFVKKNKEKPFLAVLSHYLVHDPVQPKPEKLVKYKKKATTDQDNPGYAAMMESVDESVGRLVKALDDLGVADNTLIVFTSDNGGYLRRTSNFPLLGGKSTCFEGGHRVPLIVSWPGHVKPNSVSNEPSIGMDFYPTFLDAAGLKDLKSTAVDGVSLVQAMTQSRALEKRPLVFHHPHYTGTTSPYSSIIYDGKKLIRFYNDEAGRYFLFDLEKDRAEQNDLSTLQPEVTQQLAERLEAELNAMGAKFPTKNPDYKPDSKRLSNRMSTYKSAQRYYEKAESKLSTQK